MTKGMAAMLVYTTKEHNYNSIVIVHQHGGYDLTCKPRIVRLKNQDTTYARRYNPNKSQNSLAFNETTESPSEICRCSRCTYDVYNCKLKVTNGNGRAEGPIKG